MNLEKHTKLTEKEQKVVDEALSLIPRDVLFPEHIAAKLPYTTAARALEEYATEQLENAISENNKVKQMEVGTAAMETIKKAFLIHPLPLYLCRMADFSLIAEQLMGKTDSKLSKELYKKFIKAQKEYVPDEVDKLVLKGWDIQELIDHANEVISSYSFFVLCGSFAASFSIYLFTLFFNSGGNGRSSPVLFEVSLGSPYIG